jgi:DNA-binding winged helix-turn-helix (wHTH) protein/tetratricopeptide (TPR) repeat protein
MKSFEDFRLDVTNQCLWQGDTRIPLMPKPFAVLRYLVEHPGRLVTTEQLLGAIWPDTYVQPEILRRYILEIRRALGDRAEAPRFVQTFPKRGYQFIAPVFVEDEGPATNLPPLDAGPARAAARLVGRASALADLDRSLSAARRGQRQVVFVVGEPGIGKTSLVDTFQRAITSAGGVVVARGQSVEGFGGKEAYYPLLEAIGQWVRGPSRAAVLGTLRANAPTWLIQFPSLVRPEQQAALQREILGATRERMVRELCEALEVITETMPLVIILEDLHWVDPSTLDVISAIARRREPAQLLVVGTVRPADLILSGSPLKALKQDLVLHRLSHEVELERLSESDVADYVAAEFAPGDLPPELGSVIFRHSDGNPLFMTAMLDHLVQQRVVFQVNGRWSMTVPVASVDPGVPETLKQMLEMQLRHASEAEQQLLKCASVAGQRFTIWSVATMLEDDPSTIEAMCEALADRQQFLKPSGDRDLCDGASTAEFQFRHALYREVIYRRLTPTQRRAFHLRLAEGFEALRCPVVPEMAAEAALHFEEGQDYERAVKYLMVGAQNATRRYAHQQAVEVLEHAQELLPRLPPDRTRALDFQLLERIGNAYYAQGDMDRSACAYASIATHAAEDGLLLERAEALMRLSHPAESIPFFLRAVEIDPNFATAYVSLSRIYSNLGEVERAKEYAKLAYDRRDLVNECDRLSITYQYHYEVTGDQARASDALEEWKQAFPSAFQPANSLAVMHNFLGDFARAVEEGQEAVRRDPSHGYPYSNLAHAYRGLGRFDDARATAAQAVERGVETLPTRRLLYQLAILAGDDEAAARHFDWARDRPREFDMIGARAQAAAWSGRVADARVFYENAARLAELRHLPDVATNHLAWATAMEIAYGNLDRAGRLARRVLDRRPSYDPRLRAALALALGGSPGEAEALANELSTTSPAHTLINSVLVPIVRSGIELGRARPECALDHLRVVAPYELGFIAALAPIYLRAQSYLMLGLGQKAADEFQRLLDHRGSDPFSPFVAVARLGLGRALAMAGDVPGSLRAYEHAFAAFTEADADLPALLDARREYDRLRDGGHGGHGGYGGHGDNDAGEVSTPNVSLGRA